MTLFPPVEHFMEAMATREAKNKVYGLFGSFTWASAVPKALRAYAERIGWTVSADLEVKHAANSSTASLVADFAQAFMTAYSK